MKESLLICTDAASQEEVDGMKRALQGLGKTMRHPKLGDRIVLPLLLCAYSKVALEYGMTQEQISSEIRKGQDTLTVKKIFYPSL